MIALRTAFALLALAAFAPQQDVDDLRRVASEAPEAEHYPSSDAIVLRHETRIQIAADGTVRSRLRRVVKSFNDRGVERFSSLRVPFSLSDSAVKLVKARTLKPNNALIELADNAFDVELVASADARDYTDLLIAVLKPPQNDLGDVVEILASYDREHVDTRRLSGWIDFRGPDPVAEQTLAIRLPAGIPMSFAFSSDVGRPVVRQVGSTTVYNWVLPNRPTLPREEWSADRGVIGSRVLFSTYPSWADVHRHLAGNIFADLSLPAEASAVADGLVEGKPDLAQIASRLYAFFNGNIESVDLPAELIKYRTRSAARIFESGYAYSYDFAVLALAMLKEAGVETDVALVSASESFVNSVPAPAQFDRIAVVVRADGETLWLYAGEPLEQGRGLPPFGRTVMWLKPNSFRLERIGETEAKKNSTQTRTELELAEDGTLRGNSYFSCSGTSTPYFTMAGTDSALAESASQMMSDAGLPIEIESALLLHHSPTVCRYELSYSVPGLVTASDELSFIRLPYPESADPAYAVPIWRQTRRTPLVLPSPWEQQGRIDILLRPGMQPYLMPQAVTLINEVGRLEISSRYDPTDRRLTVERYLRIDQRTVQPRDYPSLRDLLSHWRSPACRMVVVSRNSSK